MSIDHPSDAVKIYKTLPELVPEKVNLNGATKQSLVEGYLKILNAIRVLDAAMADAQPHGRDYQSHSDPEAHVKARSAWAYRRVLINEMFDDFEHSAEMVQTQ